MFKMPGYDYLITNILDKFLLSLGYITPDTNMSLYMAQKVRDFGNFFMDVAISGVLIHVALFFVYWFLNLHIPLLVHPLLIISYGLFHHIFLNWIPKPKQVRLHGK